MTRHAKQILILLLLAHCNVHSQTTTWAPIANSSNIYGGTCSNSKPLQYKSQLNVVSFIYPNSITYSANPYRPVTGTGNVLVAMLSNNWGSSWDSTCVWNSNNKAQYPQAGIYNPPINTVLANARIVGTGATANAQGFAGTCLLSKKIGSGNYSNSAGNDTQFVANSAPYGSLGKLDHAQYDFVSTNDGLVRSIGIIAKSVNPVVTKFRGAKILTGTYGNNKINWLADSIMPPFLKNSVTNEPMADPIPHMAWNDAGTVGYVWFIGCRQNAVGLNSGYQPIVYKTLNSGVTWAAVPPMDFSNPPLNTVLKALEPIANSTLIIPKFNHTEGIDGTVDNFGNLHLASTLLSTAKSHPDSLHLTQRFLSADGEKYCYKHTPGKRPYIYDFTLNNTNWEVSVVDSMSSEAPGTTPSVPGYSINPWDGDGDTVKVASGARIQLSRTPDGEYIVYTWSESDTNFTYAATKWNAIPNIKARIKRICVVKEYGYNEVNITNPANGSNVLVSSKAVIFYVSSKCILNSFNVSNYSANIKLPLMVFNNQNVPLTQGQSNTLYYATSYLNFGFPFFDPFPGSPDFFAPCVVGLKEYNKDDFKTALFPNPTKNEVNINFGQNLPAELKIECLDLLGNNIVLEDAATHANTVRLNMAPLNAGIYFVRISDGNKLLAVKKIIKE